MFGFWKFWAKIKVRIERKKGKERNEGNKNRLESQSIMFICTLKLIIFILTYERRLNNFKMYKFQINSNHILKFS